MDFDFQYHASDSPFVERIWRTRSDGPGSFVSQAGCNWEMVFWRQQGKAYLTVRGPETRASLALCPADTEFLGITFKLGTFMPRLPVSRLVDGEVVVPEHRRNAFWLHGSSWEFPDFENAETFVARLVRDEHLACDPAVEGALHGRRQYLSVRALQYRFVRATGLTHSSIRQIERANRAATLLQQGSSIGDTIFEAGYVDQPHMTRSLKQLVGRTPAQLAGLRAA